MQEIHSLYDILNKENILLTFMGEVTPEITNMLLGSFKKAHNIDNTDKAVKRVYAVAVEGLENLARHSELKFNLNRPDLFILGRQLDHYFVYTGNYVTHAEADAIAEKMASLEGLTKEQLKEKYRDLITKGKLSEKGGAGVGIVDMAIRCDNNINCYIRKVDDNLSFYVLNVRVMI